MLVLLERADCPIAMTVRPWDRFLVRLRAFRLDCDLAAGASPDASVALALRAQMLVRAQVRRDLAPQRAPDPGGRDAGARRPPPARADQRGAGQGLLRGIRRADQPPACRRPGAASGRGPGLPAAYRRERAALPPGQRRGAARQVARGSGCPGRRLIAEPGSRGRRRGRDIEIRQVAPARPSPAGPAIACRPGTSG